MASELICPIHGPYPASAGSCPRCAIGGSNRPQAPNPLDEEDNMPTDLGGGYSPGGGRMSLGDDEAPTELPVSRKGGRRILDLDEEETSLGRRLDDDKTELEFEEKGVQVIFWVKEGPRRGRIHKITDEMFIGRKNADLVIDNPKVSAPHAKVIFENEEVVIGDLLSKNGTYVNGEKIKAATTLKENDLVKIGDVTFVVKILD